MSTHQALSAVCTNAKQRPGGVLELPEADVVAGCAGRSQAHGNVHGLTGSHAARQVDREEPPSASPEANTSVYEVVQVQVPIFLSRQVFVKVRPGRTLVPSGTVTSAMNWARSQLERARAGRLLIVAAGRSDSMRAATIIAKPAGILDLMTPSFTGPTTTSPTKTPQP